LEKKRRCGFVAGAQEGPAVIVWARKEVTASSCPKSLITPQSLAWLEQFFAWKTLGGSEGLDGSARQAEAFCLLEAEMTKEKNREQR